MGVDDDVNSGVAKFEIFCSLVWAWMVWGTVEGSKTGGLAGESGIEQDCPEWNVLLVSAETMPQKAQWQVSE